MRFALAALIVTVIFTVPSCSSSAPEPTKAKAAEPAAKRHRLAKHLELVGLRLSESGVGKLRVRYVIVNHSEADLGNLTLKVRLVTTTSKPGELPLAEFESKLPSLGPHEIQDVTAIVPTKLRVYELPDWQFLKPEFDIVSPAE
ncbi:MAG TPA: hypothetical protein VGP79_16265 [Bryobacteraceae bacterium]|nr:hypothetical protein [Bryobacteraceae bacterium]